MSHALSNGPSPPPSVGRVAPRVHEVAQWLGGLLDAARDREDAGLCRLIASVIDDLGQAPKA